MLVNGEKTSATPDTSGMDGPVHMQLLKTYPAEHFYRYAIVAAQMPMKALCALAAAGRKA
jgi:hypothetical protein